MVYILGGWQSDFSRNWAREGMDIADAFTEAVNEGLSAAAAFATKIGRSAPPQLC
jgi:acetyl-CoA C-acetyltransferase